MSAIESLPAPQISVSQELGNRLRLQYRRLFIDGQVHALIGRALNAALAEPNAFLVQVGAYDGAFDDPVYPSVGGLSLRGLLIEPQTEAIKALNRRHALNPNVRIVQSAVAEEERTLTLYRGSANDDSFHGAVAGTNHDLVTRALAWHSLRRPFADYSIISEQVPARPLGQILGAEAIKPEIITVFVSDTEGYDGIAVNQLLDYGAQPSVVLYEHLHLSAFESQQVHQRLLETGYDLQSGYKDTLAQLH